VVALRRDLDEINSAFEEKDEKLKILENYILEEALGAEKKKEDEQSRALEYATGMSAELTDSQIKVRELTEKLAEMTQVIQVYRRSKQQNARKETMVHEERS
jgi:5-methylcytosine-specific restriction endonuclease McrBC regulatory subunit McrC